MGRLGGLVDLDGVQGLTGDGFTAVDDRLKSGAADQLGEAADGAVGALVKVAVEFEQVAGLVTMQAQSVFERGDQTPPVLPLCTGAVGERFGVCDGVASCDLLSPDAAEQAAGGDVDAGQYAGGGDALGQVFELVGGFGPGLRREVEVVDLVVFTDRRNS
ncbi:hypothetical protein ABZY09_35650 [Streptomyces sp. NPDC002928]|uniref:hypothetical protein n=1 Tax=Streptomyces sp. NPDC002928 TaxID=3154440 RepID=UPI0033A00889